MADSKNCGEKQCMVPKSTVHEKETKWNKIIFHFFCIPALTPCITQIADYLEKYVASKSKVYSRCGLAFPHVMELFHCKNGM